MSMALRLGLDAVTLRAGAAANGRLLCERLSFAVNAGERWVALGPNGAGKSTLLAAMAGVLPVSSGHVALQGRPLSQWRLPELAERRAWCPQFWLDPFPATVAETAAMSMRRGAWWRTRGGNDDAAVHGVLEELDLVALAQADVRLLSGGERQRVAIAGALLQDAPLLLLDEPASHLDMAHQRLLLRVLARRSAQGTAVVASVHDLNLAWELATHAVLLDGRGGAVAGRREDVMRPEHLGAAFGVAIERDEAGGRVRFWAVEAPA